MLRGLQRNPTVYEGECSGRNFLDRQTSLRFRRRPRARRDCAVTRLPARSARGRGEPHRYGPRVCRDCVGGRTRRRFAVHDTLDAVAQDAAPATRRDLRAAQTEALGALHAYRTWLEANCRVPFRRFCGRQTAVRVVFAPRPAVAVRQRQVAAIGRLELARDRALEAWEANRDAQLRAAASQPAFTSKAAFLRYYERPWRRLIAFVKDRGIVDIPSYVGPFHIVEVPKALAATYPGGFMNPPAMFSKDPEGFYFVPDFSANKGGFFVAAARQSVLPVLGHEGIPGHFLQFSYAYHNPDFVRHVHDDGVFAEGWAFYGEEMLMRQGLYDADPAARRQVIHLMRHRATRVGVDVGAGNRRDDVARGHRLFSEKRRHRLRHRTRGGDPVRHGSRASDRLPRR